MKLSLQKIASFVYTNKTDWQCVRPSSERQVFATKGFLNLRKLLMQTKQMSLPPPKNFVFVTCGDLQVVFSSKENHLLAFYLMVFYPLQLLKQNFLLKFYLKTLFLMKGSSLSEFSSGTDEKLHEIFYN